LEVQNEQNPSRLVMFSIPPLIIKPAIVVAPAPVFAPENIAE
jgi:hypothetical protein